MRFRKSKDGRTKRSGNLACHKASWRGREAYYLENGRVHLTALTGGGHVAEFCFERSTGLPQLNPLWIPPWKTIEPYHYQPKAHTSLYGPINEGKLMSGLVGHNICLDYFGPPSDEEAKRGFSTHGEAPSAKWRRDRVHRDSKQVGLTLSVRLTVAGLKLTRTMTLRRGESVVYFQETIQNEREADYFFQWTQHVTLRPPFLSQTESRIAIPATNGKTFPQGYDEGKALLASDRLFRWPDAPTVTGAKVDLSRVLLRPGLGFVASVLLDPRRDLGFVAAINGRRHLMIGYCFRRCAFPWVTVWEENRTRTDAPWREKAMARGLEFGTSPFPIPRREAFALGPLFGTPTLAHIPARGRKTVTYMAFRASTPSNFGNISDVKLAGGEILITGSMQREVLRIAASGSAQTSS